MEITYRDSFTISADTISVESKEQPKSGLKMMMALSKSALETNVFFIAVVSPVIRI